MMIMGLAWAYLIIACILEPIWVIFLEKSDNFKNKGWGFATIIAVLLCLYMLSLAVKEIGPGVAYSILAGIGAIGTVLAGYLLKVCQKISFLSCFVQKPKFFIDE